MVTKGLTAEQRSQHAAVLTTASTNLAIVIDAVETLNDQSNYDSLLDYLDSAKSELDSMRKKVG